MNSVIELAEREQREQVHQERVGSYIEVFKKADWTENQTGGRRV